MQTRKSARLRRFLCLNAVQGDRVSLDWLADSVLAGHVAVDVSRVSGGTIELDALVFRSNVLVSEEVVAEREMPLNYRVVLGIDVDVRNPIAAKWGRPS